MKPTLALGVQYMDDRYLGDVYYSQDFIALYPYMQTQMRELSGGSDMFALRLSLISGIIMPVFGWTWVYSYERKVEFIGLGEHPIGGEVGMVLRYIYEQDDIVVRIKQAGGDKRLFYSDHCKASDLPRVASVMEEYSREMTWDE